MGRNIDYTPYRIMSKMAGMFGVGRISYDPTGTSASLSLQREKPTSIEQGIVIRSGPGGYDCSVKIGQYEVPCNILVSQTTQGFGITRGEIPVEGTCVFVLLQRGSYACGWIIGAIPRSKHLDPNDETPVDLYESYPTADEVNTYNDNIAYKLIHQGKESTGRLWSNAERPQDIVPGESFLVNESNCGVTTTMYDVSLTGGGSFVRVGRLDDEIRIRSTNFTKWTNSEAVSEFNDGGYISSEGRDYSYQGELLGSSGLAGREYEEPKDTDEYEPRPRTRWWKGFLGNLFSWFTVRARKDRNSDDDTLVSVHASQGGNIMVRSTGGISLERYPKIPIPKRLKEPWDPEGDREKSVEHKPIESFTYDDPHARGLVESSKMAWAQKAMYQRFDELKKDFEVKDEADVKVPGNDDDDPTGSSEIDQQAYGDRKAGLFIGDDGSVIIRDAWGSEITMVGGNVLISTPGNVITTSNKDIVSIARQSVVVRGTEASEISSEEGDVRVHAKKLLALAGGTDKTSGGVLIESLSKSSMVNAAEEAGSEASIGGVVIRSEEAGVSLSGKNTYVSGLDNVFVTGGPDGAKREGSVFINGKTVIMGGSDMVAGICDTSTFLVTPDFAGLFSTGSTLVYGNSAMIMNGDQVPILWDSAGEPPDLSDINEAWKLLQDSDTIQPFNWDNLKDNAMFSFRKAVQANTMTGIEPWEKNKTFTLYEPYWQVMHDVKDPMASGTPYKVKVEPVHGSECWPGKGPIETGVFKKYGDGNMDKGLSKPRGELKNKIEISQVLMSEFEI